MALIVAHCTYQVYRIEVRTFFKHILLLRVVHVNLRTFEDLQGNRTVAVVSKERTAARLAYVLHHAADTHRTVQLLFQVNHQFSIFQVLRFGVLAEQLLLYKLQDVENLLVRVLAAVQQLQIGKSLLLQSDEHTGNQLLI